MIMVNFKNKKLQILLLIILSSITYLLGLDIKGFKFNGNNSLGFEVATIDNSYYKSVYFDGIADGFNLSDNFFLQSKIAGYNLTFMGSLIVHKEDEAFRKIFLEASKDNIIFNLGDVYPQETELSLTNIRVRGFKFEYSSEYDDLSYKYKLLNPLFTGIKKGDLVNNQLPSYYYLRQDLTKLVRAINFKVFIGYAHISSNVNITEGSSEPPDQVLTAVRTNLSLAGNNSLGFTLLKADDKETVSGYDKQEGDLYSIDYKNRSTNLFFEKDRFSIFGEFAKSNYNQNAGDTEPSQKDNAYFAGITYEHKNLNLLTKYFNYGENFKTMGNPYLQIDKLGYYSELNYSLCDIIYFDIWYEDYKNNLDDDVNDSSEISKTFTPTIRLKFPEAPDWTFFYQNMEVSEKSNIDISEKEDYNIGAKYKLSIFNINVNYKHTTYDEIDSDSNSYKSNGYAVSLNYTLFNNRLNMFHYFYMDKFDYKSDSQTENTFITLNSNIQVVPDKITLNSLLEFRKSKSDNNSILDVINGEISLNYILDYTKQVALKLRYTDEDYQGTSTDNKIFAGKIEYKVNF